MTITDTSTFVDKINGQVDGLRRLRDFVANHPDLPTPYEAMYGQSGYKIHVPNHADDTAAELARVVGVLTDGAPLGSVTKTYGDDGYVRVVRMFGPVPLEAWTSRDEVCERRVVGVEQVEVPDPDAPTVTVEREIVEWDCAPILAGAVKS